MKRGLLFSLAGLSLLLTQAQDLPDSMTHWREEVSQSWVPEGTIHFDYDANGRVLSQTTTKSGYGIVSREEFVYDANGNQLQYKKLQRNGSAPDLYTSDSITYQYNANQYICRRAVYNGNDPLVPLELTIADSFAYGMDQNNRINYREEYYAFDEAGWAMNWKDERRDSLYYSGSDTLPNRLHGFTWNMDSGKYIHTLIQDSLRWELGCDFGFEFFPSDNIHYQLDSLGVFRNFARRFTTGPSGRIESQVQLVNFPTIGFDTTMLILYSWDSRGNLKLTELYTKFSGVLTFNNRTLDSLVYTFDRVTRRYQLYENLGIRVSEYYEYHYSTTGLGDIAENGPGFFPNPVRQGESLFLQPETKVLSIVGISGQKQLAWSYDGQNLSHNLAPGIYLVKLQQGDGISVQRLQVIP